MNVYFTRYAEQKFGILNKHRVSLTKQDIENVIREPNKVDKKGKYLAAKKENTKVVYQKEEDALKIITFYPV